MRREFYFDSCGAGKIRCLEWAPDNQPTAVIQIVHGVTEHVERYDQFARYLNKKGYLVVANDHMGHGKSVDNGGTLGYFDGGWDAVVEDILHLKEITCGAHPELPYILLGQSMGSLLLRTILMKHPDSGISGAVICGTLWIEDRIVKAGLALARSVCLLRGERTPSPLLRKVMFGGNNRRVEHRRTTHDWLTRDAVIVDEYVADPMCGFTSSCGLLRDMLGGVLYIQQEELLTKMDKELPVLFLSGGDDPVGGYGAGVRRAAAAFEDAGMRNVEVKIFPLGRHEMLNEINRAEVFRNVNIWIRGNFL